MPEPVTNFVRCYFVRCCARCQEDHEVRFFQFSRNDVEIRGAQFTHWGICPNTGEPILMQTMDKPENGNPDQYGSCPHCGGRATLRELRLGGNDTCENGHVYPSRQSVRNR